MQDYQHQWIASNKLAKGERPLTANGTPATVVGGSVPAVRDGWMWDLTVPGNNDHDFYVVVSGDATASSVGPVVAVRFSQQQSGDPLVLE